MAPSSIGSTAAAPGSANATANGNVTGSTAASRLSTATPAFSSLFPPFSLMGTPLFGGAPGEGMTTGGMGKVQQQQQQMGSLAAARQQLQPPSRYSYEQQQQPQQLYQSSTMTNAAQQQQYQSAAMAQAQQQQQQQQSFHYQSPLLGGMEFHSRAPFTVGNAGPETSRMLDRFSSSHATAHPHHAHHASSSLSSASSSSSTTSAMPPSTTNPSNEYLSVDRGATDPHFLTDHYATPSLTHDYSPSSLAGSDQHVAYFRRAPGGMNAGHRRDSLSAVHAGPSSALSAASLSTSSALSAASLATAHSGPSLSAASALSSTSALSSLWTMDALSDGSSVPHSPAVQASTGSSASLSTMPQAIVSAPALAIVNNSNAILVADDAPLSLPTFLDLSATTDRATLAQASAEHYQLAARLDARITARTAALAELQRVLDEDRSMAAECQRRIAAMQVSMTADAQQVIEEPTPAREQTDASASNDTTEVPTTSPPPLAYAKLFSNAVSDTLPSTPSVTTSRALSVNGEESGTDSNNNTDVPIAAPAATSSTAPTSISFSAHGRHITPTTRVNSHEDQICRKYNRGECFKSEASCNYFHECMRCGGAHARIDCPKSTDARATDDLPDPCIKWNYSSCTWDDKCFRRHECFHCLGPHRIVDCPQRPVLNESLMRSVREAAEGAAAEPCANYNHGRCRLADKCKRAHVCSECGHKGHTVDACTKNRNHDRHFVDLPTIVQDAGAASTAKSIADASDTTGQTYDVYSYHDVCLNWNNSRCRLPSSQCRRVHVCSLCNSPSHAAMECPMPGLAPRDLVEAGVEICLNFNNGRCSGVTERGVGIECKRVHVCTVCKRSGHPAIKCDWDEKKAAAAAAATSAEVASAAAAKRAGATSPTSEICRNWNEGKCRLGSERCKRVHACSSCGSRGHTAPDCTATAAQPTPKDSSATSSTAVVGNGSSDICMNWNLGRCRLGKRCRRPHLCWSCGRGDHVHKDCRRST